MLRLSLFTALMLAILTTAVSLEASPQIGEPLIGKWQLDFGLGYHSSGDDFYRSNFDHGVNGRISVTYRHHAGIILGPQYRVSRRPSASAADLELNTHLLGLKLGRDFLSGAADELSVGFILYYAYARFSDKFVACRYAGPCLFVESSFAESGIGLGLDLSYAHQLGRVVGLGFEVEYNSTWIDDLREGEFGNVGGLWLGPFLRFRL